MLFVKIQILRENGTVVIDSVGYADAPMEWRASDPSTELIFGIKDPRRLTGWKLIPAVVTEEGDTVATWNDCPDCGANWKDLDPTPGMIHRTRLCPDCARKEDR